MREQIMKISGKIVAAMQFRNEFYCSNNMTK